MVNPYVHGRVLSHPCVGLQVVATGEESSDLRAELPSTRNVRCNNQRERCTAIQTQLLLLLLWSLPPLFS